MPTAFPDLDPFVLSPFRQALEERLGAEGEGGSPSSGSRVPPALTIRGLLEMLDTAEASDQVLGDDERRDDPRGVPSAWLQPRLALSEKMVFVLLPPALNDLRPLWGQGSWSDAEVDYANAVADLFRRIVDGPDVVFSTGKDRANQEGLAAFVQSFNASVKRPERLAAMIFTFDDGPFVGLSATIPDGLSPIAVRSFGQDLEIRLYVLPGAEDEDEDAERHVIAGYANKKRLWARLVSSAPRPSVREVGLGAGTRQLGRYGWAIYISADWSGGYEGGTLYVDQNGGFLFYFLSW